MLNKILVIYLPILTCYCAINSHLFPNTNLLLPDKSLVFCGMNVIIIFNASSIVMKIVV